MKIYLAAGYYAQPRMREYREVLHAQGHEVTSRWIDEANPEPVRQEHLTADPLAGLPHAQHDLADIRRADAVVMFTGYPSTTGGRHVELGYALGLGKRVILVGPLENVFHSLPEIEHHLDWDALMADWRVAA